MGAGYASSPPPSREDHEPDEASVVCSVGTTGHHSTLPEVKVCHRASLILCYCLQAYLTIMSVYGFMGRINPVYVEHRETPLTPESWAYSIWVVILILQGLAVVYQALPGAHTEAWRLHICIITFYGWNFAWALGILNQVMLHQRTAVSLWVGLFSLLGSFSAFAWTLQRIYGLRRRFSLGPPTAQTYVLYFVSTDLGAAWLSFCLANGVLVFCQAHGVSKVTVEALAIVLLLAVCIRAVWMVSRWKSSYYGLGTIWILVAIFSHQRSHHMRLLTSVLLFCLGLVTIFSVIRKRSTSSSRDLTVLPPEVQSKLVSSGSSEITALKVAVVV